MIPAPNPVPFRETKKPIEGMEAYFQNLNSGTIPASRFQGVIMKTAHCKRNAWLALGSALFLCLFLVEDSRAASGSFTPTIAYAWGSAAATTHNVMMTPIVTQLDDDNTDSVIDGRDIPDIVFLTFSGIDYNNNSGTSAVLRAISVIDGSAQVKWATTLFGGSADHPARGIAAGDIDGLPGNEIVTCTRDSRVRAYTSSGVQLWLSDPLANSCIAPSLADLDQDGNTEIIVRSAILEGSTGAILGTVGSPNSANVAVADIDADGFLDIVTPSSAYDSAGTLFVDTDLVGRHPAVADLDLDGVPEVISIDNTSHTMSVWHVAANPAGYEIVREGLDLHNNQVFNPCCQLNPNSAGCQYGGGPPVVSDFDGDGYPDVGTLSGPYFIAFSGAHLMNTSVADVDTVLYARQVQDCSSAQTGATAFDFFADGSGEVVFSDELNFTVLDGETGNAVFQTCNTSGTIFEYPVIADVDGDGSADIVAPSNSYSGLNCSGTKTTGIRIFTDPASSWAAARRVWNQHTYHVTNVLEDGTIPTVEDAHWEDPALNSFRAAATMPRSSGGGGGGGCNTVGPAESAWSDLLWFAMLVGILFLFRELRGSGLELWGWGGISGKRISPTGRQGDGAMGRDGEAGMGVSG